MKEEFRHINNDYTYYILPDEQNCQFVYPVGAGYVKTKKWKEAFSSWMPL